MSSSRIRGKIEDKRAQTPTDVRQAEALEKIASTLFQLQRELAAIRVGVQDLLVKKASK